MHRNWLLAAIILLLATACGGNSSNSLSASDESGSAGPAAGSELVEPAEQPQAGAWPPGIPDDGVQPWERVDASGFVQRSSSAINADSEFAAGVEVFQSAASGSGASTSEQGEALRLDSGAEGSGDRAWSIYRLPLGGAALGALSVDVNPASAGQSTHFFIGLADYGAMRWQWFGPFDENNVRLAGSLIPAGDYTSPQGSVFVTLYAYDGTAFDVVGVAANPDNSADTTPPAAPTGLSLTPVSGGVEAVWNSVVAPDLAGYRVYYSNSSFSSPADPGVKSLPSLTSLTRALVQRPSSGPIFVAIRAVDTSANQSLLGTVQTATIASASAAAPLKLSVNANSAMRDGSISLSSSAGYSNYDLDLDGDGVYETSNAIGSAVVDTSGAGLIRANVRASEGDMVAYGGISVIILANSRPAANASASDYTPIPDQLVTLIGFGEDAEDAFPDLVFDWDTECDGLYDFTDLGTVNDVLFGPGLHNVRLRVTDSQGAWDVDTITINVSYGQPPVADLIMFPSHSIEVGDSVQLGVSCFDFDGEIVEVSLDLSGDPLDFETSISLNENFTFTPIAGGDYPIGARAVDNSGLVAVDFGNIHVRGMSNFTSFSATTGIGSFCSLADVGGRMAATYYDANTDSVMYIRASNSSGTGFEAPVLLQNLLGGRAFSSLAMVSGNPATVYQAAGGSELHYRRATNSSGTAWGGPVTIASGSDVGNWCTLKMISGRPAVAYDNSTTDSVHYRRASDATGTAWAADDTVDNCSTLGSLVNLIDIDGVPAMAYRYIDNHLVYLLGFSLDDMGNNYEDLPGIVSGINPRISLKKVNGNPAIAYEEAATLRYTRAISASGNDGWGPVRNVGTPGALCALETFNDVPLIAYYDANDESLHFQQAEDEHGFSFAQWSYSLAMGDASSPLDKQSIRMAYVNNRLSVLLYSPAVDVAAFANFVP
ncbi:hypothetical protein IT575_03060 [bacterium]|nr:hypothetical protein [bacterium]